LKSNHEDIFIIHNENPLKLSNSYDFAERDLWPVIINTIIIRHISLYFAPINPHYKLAKLMLFSVGLDDGFLIHV
jgi:hypothetical protein